MSTTPTLLQPEERVLSTLNADGSRRWLQPRVSPGRFLLWRQVTAYALIAIFTLIPWININGKPAMFLDVVNREFTFFGFTFLPTDTVLLALFLVASIIAVFLLTALLGRVWCGWACPQTVYMEFVYRPIERLFDGTRGRGGRSPADLPPWRRVAKFAVFLLVSMFLAHTFLAYFVGVEALQQWMRRSPLEHPLTFLVMVGVTGLMLFDFGYFREQTCIVACPYGRLQAVLLDRQSLIISYDERRGEPRGKLRDPAGQALPVLNRTATDADGAAEPRRGDCIDCGLCVVTCPTGIDIRAGLQMECIGCAQCIDACDVVMDKIKRPRGLIRYSSQAAMAGEKRSWLRARVVLYPALLAVVGSIFVLMLARKPQADVTLIRAGGAPFSLLADGRVANPYRLKIVNRTRAAATYESAVVNHPGGEVVGEAARITLAPGEDRHENVLIVLPREAFTHSPLSVTVRVADGSGFSTELNCHVFGPIHPASATTQKGAGGG